MLEAHKYHCSVRVLYPTRLCLQCACDSLKKKLSFSVHCCFSGVHSCEIIVKRLSGFCASGIQKKKKYHKWHKAAVVQRNKENLC